jgi:hypothetical protein
MPETDCYFEVVDTVVRRCAYPTNRSAVAIRLSVHSSATQTIPPVKPQFSAPTGAVEVHDPPDDHQRCDSLPTSTPFFHNEYTFGTSNIRTCQYLADTEVLPYTTARHYLPLEDSPFPSKSSAGRYGQAFGAQRHNQTLSSFSPLHFTAAPVANASDDSSTIISKTRRRTRFPNSESGAMEVEERSERVTGETGASGEVDDRPPVCLLLMSS